MSSVTVRAYEAGDYESVAALWERVFPDDPPYNQPPDVVRRKLAIQRELFLVAVDQGQVIGTILGGYDGVRGWVYHLAVHPDRRRQRVGGQLMGAVEAQLQTLGAPKLNLQVRAGNETVVKFYESLGYRVEPRVSMGKRL